MPKIIVITGPTATGKTTLGVLLAKQLGGEVISADSMQIYRDLNIGTAKPTEEEMRGVPHHMIDIVPPTENYSVARYVQEASACIEDILSRGLNPIVVGGTGLYIDSLLSGRTFAADSAGPLRRQLSKRYEQEGGEALLAALEAVDPESARKLHANDKKRIVRALEIYQSTGKTITEHNDETRRIPPKYPACKIALTFAAREDLYDRINSRVDAMISAGLADEVRHLLSRGLTEKDTAMQAIGYKEMAEAVRGRVSLSEAAETIKMESRRYAKRQLSWLRKDPSVHWIRWGKEPDFDSGLHDSTMFLEDTGYNGAVNNHN